MTEYRLTPQARSESTDPLLEIQNEQLRSRVARIRQERAVGMETEARQERVEGEAELAGAEATRAEAQTKRIKAETEGLLSAHEAVQSVPPDQLYADVQSALVGQGYPVDSARIIAKRIAYTSKPAGGEETSIIEGTLKDVFTDWVKKKLQEKEGGEAQEQPETASDRVNKLLWTDFEGYAKRRLGLVPPSDAAEAEGATPRRPLSLAEMLRQKKEEDAAIKDFFTPLTAQRREESLVSFDAEDLPKNVPSSMAVEMYREVLLDRRERERIKMEHDSQERRTNVIETIGKQVAGGFKQISRNLRTMEVEEATGSAGGEGVEVTAVCPKCQQKSVPVFGRKPGDVVACPLCSTEFKIGDAP